MYAYSHTTYMDILKGEPQGRKGQLKGELITGQNEREETTQDTIVTESAAFASYEINYLTYITATYTKRKIYYWSKRKRRNYSRYNRYQKCCVRKL